MKTEDRIVVAMAEIMRRQGYSGTGMKQLAEAADAPIGSIYHHFANGKRDVAAEAMRRSGAAYGELVISLLAPQGDIAEALIAAFTLAAETIAESDWMNMCPVGTVAAEIADTEPELRGVAAGVMTGWVESGAELLRSRGLGDSDARALADAIVSGLEGAFIAARVRRSTEPLLATGRALAAFAKTLPVNESRPSADHSSAR